MEILRTIKFYTDDRAMRFLVIGGHAINSYGISRQTGDLDLLVPRDDESKWHDLLIKLKYSPGQRDSRFARYRPDQIAAWPIDLMLVDASTFNQMFEEGRDTDFSIVSVKVVSARHLAILKLHALKHYQEHRFLKDYTDLASLLRSGRAQFTKEELEALCDKYADKQLYQRLVSDLKL